MQDATYRMVSPHLLHQSISPGRYFMTLVSILVLTVRAGFSFSPKSIAASFILLRACSNFACAVSLFIAACSYATLVPVTAAVKSFTISVF